jgi:hypothetical protein
MLEVSEWIGGVVHLTFPVSYGRGAQRLSGAVAGKQSAGTPATGRAADNVRIAFCGLRTSRRFVVR